MADIRLQNNKLCRRNPCGKKDTPRSDFPHAAWRSPLDGISRQNLFRLHYLHEITMEFGRFLNPARVRRRKFYNKPDSRSAKIGIPDRFSAPVHQKLVV